jgi:mannose-1-phosphate guanylyltransferase/mannose-1-phosphate guanylyltransferase/mannose-6-phosphate isomerase
MDATDALRVRPVILSGGSGTRLWPLSRRDWPKQLIALTGDLSLLQLTAMRTPPSDRFAAPILVASERHADEILAQLGEVSIAPDCVILEPAARNTAPAVALAAFAADPDDLLLVMPSDHMIADGDAFLRAIDQGAALARAGWMVTLGLAPTRPETGFGYIRLGARLDGSAREVAEFVEKPERARAEAYCASGDYLWNGGIFLFTAGRFLAELHRHARAIHGHVRDSVAAAERDGPCLRPDPIAFAGTPSVSIDFAVMEKVDRIAVVPVEMGWSDVGSWDALHAISPCDEDGNTHHGEVFAIDTRRCLIRSEGPVVAAVGVRDLIVIATPDAVLIMPRGASQEVKRAVEALKKDGHITLDRAL